MERITKVIHEISYISNKLKSWRKEKKVSQQQVADYLNMQQSNYNRIENGKSYLDINTGFRLCAYYNKRTTELNHLNDTENNTPEIEFINKLLLSSNYNFGRGEIGLLHRTNVMLQNCISRTNQLQIDLLQHMNKIQDNNP